MVVGQWRIGNSIAEICDLDAPGAGHSEMCAPVRLLAAASASSDEGRGWRE